MSELARVAGVGAGTLYEYFATREDVIRGVEQRSWSTAVADCEAMMRELDGCPIGEAIVKLVEFGVQMTRDRAALHGITLPADPVDLAQRRVLIDGIVAVAVSRLEGHDLLPKNRLLAVRLVVKAVFAMCLLGMRDEPELVISGEYGHELGLMMARYLVRTDI